MTQSRLCGLSGRIALFAALAVLLVLNASALAATRSVSVGAGGAMAFVDSASGTSTSTIAVGDSIQWNWSSGFHSTTSGGCSGGCSPDGNWDSGDSSAPHSFSHTFSTAGTFPYHCSVHGASMQGTVIVQSAGSPPVAHFDFLPAAPHTGTLVTFEDTSTNTPTSWSWNFGDPASGTSNTSTLQNPTHAFQSAGTFHVTLMASNASGSSTFVDEVTVASGGPLACVPDTETMCLSNGRYRVTAEYSAPNNQSGHGQGVPLTGESGYFWFFSASNIEVVVKVLDACTVNNSHWVFAAGLTNVGVDLTVTDSQTGAVYPVHNPQGTVFQTVTATNAFPSSCP